MSEIEPEPVRTITEETRQDIIDYIVEERVWWWGRLEQQEFLARLYNIEEMPSHDTRFSDASGDIWQHTANNDDWEIDWLFTDSRFNLRYAADDEFIRFLAEIFQPAVKNRRSDYETWLNDMNTILAGDAWQIVGEPTKTGRIKYKGVRAGHAGTIATRGATRIESMLNSDYMSNMVHRLHQSVNKDAELCIGTSKEFLESVAKTVIEAKGGSWSSDDSFPTLVKQCFKIIKLVPDGVTKKSQTEEAFTGIARSLGAAVDKVAEVRNLHGTGHGKSTKSVALEKRHANLIMTLCVGVAEFIFESAMEEGLSGMEIVEPVDESVFDD